MSKEITPGEEQNLEIYVITKNQEPDDRCQMTGSAYVEGMTGLSMYLSPSKKSLKRGELLQRSKSKASSK